MKINSHLLKKLRAANNWSQEQLSEASGLSLRTIQRLENGGSASIESVRALAAVFDIDPNDLILSESRDVMTPFEAVERGLTRFSDFSGTATRYEYWWFLAFVLVIAAIASIIDPRATQIVGVLAVIPLIAAGTRRLRDAGHSGWWQMFFFVPYGQIVVLILLAQPTRSEAAPPMTNSFTPSL